MPTLWALFCEILACQGLSTLLNVLCVTKVSEVITDDTERAGWMGQVSDDEIQLDFLVSGFVLLDSIGTQLLIPTNSSLRQPMS